MKHVAMFSSFLSLALLLSLQVHGDDAAQAAKETPLMIKRLPDVPGKEALLEKVVLAPGQVASPHRHNADVFVYVLEGTIVTQLKGGLPRTLHAGEVFYESPTDIHNGSRNASSVDPATLLVFFVKKIGAAATFPLPAVDGAH